MFAYRWQLAVLLFCAAAVNYADRTSVSAVLPLLRAGLGLSDIALGGIGTAFLWAYALGSPAAGVLADRWPRGRLLLFSLIAWSVITALTSTVGNYWQLACTRVLLGLAECLYLPAATAMIADYHGRSTRGTATGLHSAGLNLGLIGGGVTAGYLGDHYGWRAGFLLLGLAGVVLAVVSWRRLAHPPVPDPAECAARPPARPLSTLSKDLLYLLTVPSYLILMGKSMLLSVGIWTFFNWLPLYFNESFGLSLAAAGFSGTFPLQVAATVGVLCGGLASDRFARRGTRYRMLFQAFCYLASAPFLLAFLGRPGLLYISACIFGFSLLRGMGQSNENPLICEIIPQPLRSTALGLVNLMNSLTGGMGVLFAGVLKSRFSLGGVFAATASLMALASLLLLIGFRYFLDRDLARRDRWDPA